MRQGGEQDIVGFGNRAAQRVSYDGAFGGERISTCKRSGNMMYVAAGRPRRDTRRRKPVRIDETALTKGQARKLNTLRKSAGDALGEEVF